jgi:phosphohistidine phosphatase
MNELLLLRHAKAAPHDLELPDHSRRLTDGGRESARRMRDEMERLGLQVDVVLVSSARRTMQTLQCLLPFITPNQVEPMDALYLATAADLLHVLRQVPPTLRTVLVIGHNPGLHELALLLGARRPGLCGAPALEREFPTAALAQFTAPDDWGALGPRRARLVRFLRPQA